MIWRTTVATALTLALLGDAVAGRVDNPLNYLWAAVAGALWFSLAVDKKERKVAEHLGEER